MQTTNHAIGKLAQLWMFPEIPENASAIVTHELMFTGLGYLVPNARSV